MHSSLQFKKRALKKHQIERILKINFLTDCTHSQVVVLWISIKLRNKPLCT